MHLNDEYFSGNPFGLPCIVCHGATYSGTVGPPNSFRLPGGPSMLEYYQSLGSTVSTGVVVLGLVGAPVYSVWLAPHATPPLVATTIGSYPGIVLIPRGMVQATMGNLVWGTGASGAARALMAPLRFAWMTPAWAASWHAYYQWVVINFPANTAAPGRMALMETYLRILSQR